MSKEVETPEKTEPTASFQELVRTHREKHGGTLAAAMQATVKKHPEAHQAFLAAGESLDGGADDTDDDFLTLVEQCQAMRKCSRTEAMQRIARSHPNVHREYIEQANSKEG
ncbi:hypothetical protein DSCO28_71950 [Desulfosarcina ovata subsp. sediminis]|uniref:Uncharacterized protein n=1 Tax=Desulfosarcina ovata subsp. sediminis TaxID=885957 RepID=A0A5K8A250_9BACT|nr:hypothetical protein [Desulfosarcina ovata]BBO86629.1 hypothetical protein DSCO28_71950 [Desulfosarcina ovata subsp. sediminis]